MQNKKLENSVKSLVNLYTVVIGTALTLAVAGAIDANTGLSSLTLETSLLFLAFITTLVPFFHGALRHLDDAYLENGGVQVGNGALIVDYSLLFIHGLGFLVLALLLKNPAHFAWTLVAILAVDVIWGIFAKFASASKSSAVSTWFKINFIFIAFVVSFLTFNSMWPTQPLTAPLHLVVPLTFACAVRTMFDYGLCRSFYFPAE